MATIDYFTVNCPVLYSRTIEIWGTISGTQILMYCIDHGPTEYWNEPTEIKIDFSYEIYDYTIGTIINHCGLTLTPYGNSTGDYFSGEDNYTSENNWHQAPYLSGDGADWVSVNFDLITPDPSGYANYTMGTNPELYSS